MSVRMVVMLVIVAVIVTAGVAVLGYVGDRDGDLYMFLVAGSGGVWGVIIGLMTGLGVRDVIVSVWARMVSVIGGYLLLFAVYYLGVPDIVVTAWGPMQDVFGSWAIAGIMSLVIMAGTTMVGILWRIYVGMRGV